MKGNGERSNLLMLISRAPQALALALLGSLCLAPLASAYDHWNDDRDFAESDFFGDLAQRYSNSRVSAASSYNSGRGAANASSRNYTYSRPIVTQYAMPENRRPWSGLWWPRGSAELSFLSLSQGLSPFEKYDTYVFNRTGRNPLAALWEADPSNNHNYGPMQGSVDWAGHCNGLAAAACLVREPPARARIQLGARARGVKLRIAQASQASYGISRYGENAYTQVQLPGGALELTSDDLKGWLSEMFMTCSTMQFQNPQVLGTRYNRSQIDTRDPSYQDILPHYFHYLLIQFVQNRNQPIVLEVDPHLPVNNHPAYAFSARGVQRGNTVSFTNRVWLTDYAPSYQYQGTKPMVRDYTYDLTVDARGRVTGGRWTGSSVNAHPDFVWIPTGDRNAYRDRENPRLQANTVYEVMRLALGIR